MNIFNTNLDRVDESRVSARGANSKLIESVLAISEAQKKLYVNQKSLVNHRTEIATMRESNKGVKIALMRALIERDELIIKRSALKSMNERLMNHNDNLNRETDDLLRGDEVDSVCERFSLADQIKLLKEIQDARFSGLKSWRATRCRDNCLTDQRGSHFVRDPDRTAENLSAASFVLIPQQRVVSSFPAGSHANYIFQSTTD